MGLTSTSARCGVVLTALLLSPCGPLVAQPSATDPAAPAGALDPTAEYRRKLADYSLARQQYEAEATAYWTTIAEKRRIRINKRRNDQEILLDDYVLTQPPAYSGPPRLVDPAAPAGHAPLRVRKYVPVIADFLRAAVEHFSFVPQRPRGEIKFKRAYVLAASAAGLTKEQAVRIYAFEAGGNGKYDAQAGLQYRRVGARAISTALGYNQLLTPNTIGILAEKGDRFVTALEAKEARLSGEAREAIQRKIAILRRMIDFSRTVPVRWAEHEKLGDTPQGFALHALNLDIDVGPLLPTQKLLDSVVFARRKGVARPLNAAELEMMNFTGDGNGFDIVTMPDAMRRQVPTSNFFRQPSYERNPVVIRNNVVARLLAATDAKMDREIKHQGAKDMASAFSRLDDYSARRYPPDAVPGDLSRSTK